MCFSHNTTHPFHRQVGRERKFSIFLNFSFALRLHFIHIPHTTYTHISRVSVKYKWNESTNFVYIKFSIAHMWSLSVLIISSYSIEKHPKKKKEKMLIKTLFFHTSMEWMYVHTYSKISSFDGCCYYFYCYFSHTQLNSKNWENSRYLVEKACVFHLNGISYRKDRSGFSGAGRVESIAHTYVSSSSSAFGLGKDFPFSFFLLFIS